MTCNFFHVNKTNLFLGLLGARQPGTRVQTRGRLAFTTPELAQSRLGLGRPEQRPGRAYTPVDQQAPGAEGGVLEGVYLGPKNCGNFSQIFQSKSSTFLPRTSTAATPVVIQRT